MGSKRFSGIAVLLSIVGAILAFSLGEVILKVGNGLPAFVKVGLYYGIGAMLVAAMVLLSQKILPKLVGYRWKEIYFKTSLKLYIPTTLLMVGVVAGLFQFVYSLDIKEEQTIQNIVIAVDTSSSMLVTDEQGERFDAICSFIDNLQGSKQVAVMTFNDTPSVLIDFTKVKTQSDKEALKMQLASSEIEETGQTGIRQAVDMAYNLLNSQEGKGSLILLSDGAPTDGSDFDIPGLVSSYVEEGMPIYTISMMYSNPEEAQYLGEIATLTGGVYYTTSDTTMLHEVFGEISYNEDKGTIISPRSGVYVTSTFYIALRIGFGVIISLLIALAIGIMFDNKFLVKGMLIGSLIGGLIGSIVMEKMMAGDGIIALARLSYWLLLGIGLMTFTWCINFKDSYHGTRHA